MSRGGSKIIKTESEERDEAMETNEYERIIEFAKQVQAGVHPRVKVPEHMAEAARANPSMIDFAHNYYIDIGLDSKGPSLSQDSILRGYKSKWDLYSPLSPSAEPKWASKSHEVVRKIQGNWERVQKAYKILSNPALRALYDAGCLHSLAARPKPPSRGESKQPPKDPKHSIVPPGRRRKQVHRSKRVELKRKSPGVSRRN